MGSARALGGVGVLALLGAIACTERAIEKGASSLDLSAAADAGPPDGATNVHDAALVDSAAPTDLAAPADASTVDLASQDLAGQDLAIPSGLAWRPSASGTNQKLQAVWGSSAHDLWAVGYVFLHGTGDPVTWSQASVNGHGFAIWGPSAEDFFVVGRYVSYLNLAGVAFEGTGDPTSFANTSQLNQWGLYGMWVQSPESIWAVGDGASVIHGQGAPMSWSTIAIDGYYGPSPHITNAFTGCRQLFGIWGAGNEVWAIGSGEGILHGGADPTAWTLDHTVSGGSGGGCDAGDIEIIYNKDLRGIWGSSATDIWAVGHDGLILHGTGSPTTWTKVSSGTTTHLTAVWGASATDVWAVGTGGTILHGTGSPLAWAAVTSNTPNDLYGVWGLSPTEVWAVGAKGTIVHYSP